MERKCDVKNELFAHKIVNKKRQYKKAYVFIFIFLVSFIIYNIKIQKITSRDFMLSQKYIIEIFCSAIPIYQMYTVSFLLECFVTKKRKKYILVTANIITNTILNHFLIVKISSFFVRMWCMVFFVQYLLKIISFHIESNKIENEDKRKNNMLYKKVDNKIQEKNGTKHYKKSKVIDNKTQKNNKNSLGNFISYFFLPTLIYKHKFVIVYRFDTAQVAQTITKMYFTCVLFFVIKKNVCLSILEKLLRTKTRLLVFLYVPALFLSVLVCWLLLFYFYFTLFLGLLQKIASFDDHVMYEDWWNAETIGEFWRKWNIPFYLWVKKYIYFTLKKRQTNKHICKFAVFLFSAFVHEYAVGVACKKFTGTMFFGMLAQIPIDMIGKVLKKCNKKSGNIFFWLSFCCFGQPMIVYFYYKDCMK
ncbi:hypothetical protein BDAP_002505 [Binucleata daphniae]